MIQELLKKELKKRQKKNSSYSLRSFARDLKLSPSMLSRYLAGEREPSPHSLGQILDVLDIDLILKKELLDSLVSKKGLRLPQDSDYVELNSQQLGKLNHWLYFALLELLRSKNRKFTVNKIAKSLGIPEKEIAAKIEVLVDMGLLIKTESGFRSMDTKQTAKSSRKILDQIHAGYLDQAKAAMIDSKEDERSVSGVTVLSTPVRIQEAAERIKLFRRSLASYLEVKPGEKSEMLYRLQIALFPLEK